MNTDDSPTPRFTLFRAVLQPLAGATVLIFAMVLGITYIIHDALLQRHLQEQEGSALIEGALVRSHIEAAVNTRLVQSRGLAAYVSSRPGINTAEFAEISRVLMMQEPNIHSIQLAPDNVIHFVFPQAGNQKALGLRLTDLPQQRDMVDRARLQGKSVIAGPIQLVQGGQALIGRTPIFTTAPAGQERRVMGSYWGLANVLIQLDALFNDEIFKGTSGQFSFAVRGADGKGAFGGPVWGNQALFNANPVLLDITLPDGSWQLATAPVNGWDQEQNWSLWAAGVAFALLAAGFVWFLLQSPIKLREHVDKATAALEQSRQEISTINHELEQRVVARTRDLAAQYAFSQALVRAQSEIDEGVFVVENGRVVFANDALFRLSGYSIEEITGGMPFIELFHPDVRDTIMDRNRRRLAGEYVDKHYQTRFLTRDQRSLDVELAVVLIPAPPQSRLVIVARDITADKAAARALQARATAFEAAGEMIVITDVHGIIEYANRAFYEQTGYNHAEAVGQTVSSLVKSGTHDDRFYTDMWNTIMAGQTWRGEITNRRKNGSQFTAAQVIAPLTDDLGQITGFVSVKHDISERKRLEARLHRMAHFDELTGLPNRSLLFDRLNQAVARADRHNEMFATLFIDLDGFKQINDSCGHETGDALLAEAASRISFCIRGTDTAARIGGDEFIVILTDVTSAVDAERVAGKLTEVLSQPFEVCEHDCVITASIGISLFPEHGVDVESLINRADKAMYSAKKAGKNTWHMFREANIDHA